MLTCARRTLLLGRRFSSQLTEVEYEQAANDSLERLSTYLEEVPELANVDPDFDVTHAMGVLTIVISKAIGTYVINKQTPNKQIWLSSPLSGPKRYDLSDEKRWIYKHNGEHLDNLLTEEFRKIYQTDQINFRGHL